MICSKTFLGSRIGINLSVKELVLYNHNYSCSSPNWLKIGKGSKTSIQREKKSMRGIKPYQKAK